MKSYGVALISFYLLRQVLASSNITFYSDALCRQPIDEKTGPDDGTCTQFPTSASAFASMRVTSLDQTCAVSVYGSDQAYCSSQINLYVAQFGDCLNDTTVNQFSVDCQDYSAAISSAPQVFEDTSSEEEPSTDEGLSGGAKAGIGIGAAAGVLILVAIIVWLVIRNNRRKRQNEDHFLEADSKPAAPPYSELPPSNEKKAPVELPPQQQMAVEAPGDSVWPLRELAGSEPPLQVGGYTPAQSSSKSVSKADTNTDFLPVTTDTELSTVSRSDLLSPVSPEETR